MAISSVLATATNGMLKYARSVHESADRIVRDRALTESVRDRVPVEVKIPDPDIVFVPGKSDLVSEVFEIKKAEIGYSASARVIRTADDMSKNLLNILS